MAESAIVHSDARILFFIPGTASIEAAFCAGEDAHGGDVSLGLQGPDVKIAHASICAPANIFVARFAEVDDGRGVSLCRRGRSRRDGTPSTIEQLVEGVLVEPGSQKGWFGSPSVGLSKSSVPEAVWATSWPSPTRTQPAVQSCITTA